MWDSTTPMWLSRDSAGTSTPTFPSLTDNSIRRALAGDFTSTMFSAVVTAMNSFFAESLRNIHEVKPQRVDASHPENEIATEA